jgi:hypothetical protein
MILTAGLRISGKRCFQGRQPKSSECRWRRYPLQFIVWNTGYKSVAQALGKVSSHVDIKTYAKAISQMKR